MLSISSWRGPRRMSRGDMRHIVVQAYARHKKLSRGSLRIYVQELPATMNMVWPVMMRDGQFKHDGIYVSSWAFFSAEKKIVVDHIACQPP